MHRVLLVLLAAVVTVAVAWAMEGLPGRMREDIGDLIIEMPKSVAALGLIVLF
jgi:ABC-type Fe3+ transport system permease subunit